MKTTLEQERPTEHDSIIDINNTVDTDTITEVAKRRYQNVHKQESILRLVSDRHSTHYRKGKAYCNYMIHLPKKWSEGLELKNHDLFEWSILSYDLVVIRLEKIGENDLGHHRSDV